MAYYDTIMAQSQPSENDLQNRELLKPMPAPQLTSHGPPNRGRSA
ncbi:hypothetical protein Sinac_6919 [Singulisphaera acidiphila DSM 18658]|uniref:Uncharacterized protein n=1 Tax=Singulisphaera acidiphila (strain ATCC BAA-1392 / DSM 18658 / VKM B-2454 / MOB10) TaxID=886293 RepID=L0DQ67_SINAD|nr:hypothetical protein Sinac_6919 [Singulisphaera acidiphila DSM 18658]